MSNIVEFINQYSMWFIICGGSLYIIFSILEIVYGKKMKVAQCEKCMHKEFCSKDNKNSAKFCHLFKKMKEN